MPRIPLASVLASLVPLLLAGTCGSDAFFEAPANREGAATGACITCHFRMNGLPGRVAGGHGFPYHATVHTSAGRQEIHGRTVFEGDGHVSLRFPPVIYGSGSIHRIRDHAILANADPHDADRDGISGRAVLDGAGRVRRFGRKPAAATLQQFVRRAFVQELAVPKPTPSQVQTVTRFVQLLGDPPSNGFDESGPDDAQQVAEGERLFAGIGCTDCHVPVLDGVPLLSDLLVHDMGPALDDGVAAPGVASSEWRTTPLWHLRFNHTTQLHDGRSGGITHSVALHGGEGEAARDAYFALGSHDRSAIGAYLFRR